MKLAGTLLLFAMFVTACAGSPANNNGGTAEAKPQFTEEEKANMTADEKLAVHNASAKPSDQLVCRRELILGTHRKKMVCRSRGEMQINQELARKAMQETMESTMTPPSGGN